MNRLQLRRILCPVDLSPLSMNSLKWANSIARARNATLKVLHVVVPEGPAPGPLDPLDRGELMVKLRRALTATDPENTRTGAAVRFGDPGTCILNAAKSQRADVIVMGAAGADRPTRPIGSVTATVVARSDCPVLILPPGGESDRAASGVFQHIVCAVGWAPSSLGIVKQALSLAWETHGHLKVVCVMTDPSPSASDIQRTLLNAIPAEAHTWCDIQILVTPGVPATEIVKVAETSRVDILLIGPPRQWQSTTEAVLTRSLCPVLVAHDSRPLPYPVGHAG